MVDVMLDACANSDKRIINFICFVLGCFNLNGSDFNSLSVVVLISLLFKHSFDVKRLEN